MAVAAGDGGAADRQRAPRVCRGSGTILMDPLSNTIYAAGLFLALAALLLWNKRRRRVSRMVRRALASMSKDEAA
jgi:hypothetical protein